MNLQGIVSISGKGGLFKLLGQNKSGIILESLDEAKTKVISSATNKLATLNDITVYGESEDIQLKYIFQKMDEQKDTLAIPSPKAESPELKKYFKALIPEHDVERVYGSDIKKIINWFSIISVLPLFTEEETEEKTEEETKEETPETTL